MGSGNEREREREYGDLTNLFVMSEGSRQKPVQLPALLTLFNVTYSKLCKT